MAPAIALRELVFAEVVVLDIAHQRYRSVARADGGALVFVELARHRTVEFGTEARDVARPQGHRPGLTVTPHYTPVRSEASEGPSPRELLTT